MRGLPTGAALLIAVLANQAEAGGRTSAPNGLPPDVPELVRLQKQIEAERQNIQEQRLMLDAQERRLLDLGDALLDKMRAAGVPGSQLTPSGSVAEAPPPPIPQRGEAVSSVGVKPVERRRAQEVAVLAEQGSVLTRAGRITIEPTLEYARVDRNRFVFRGIEVPQSVLVGVFDINESRQDLVTVAGVARYGVTNRLEIGLKVPWVYRNDASVLVPLVQNPPQSGTGTINQSAEGSGIGDVEFLARYQLTNGTGGWPFLTANLQVIAPTGTSPYKLPRDGLGNATRAATGFGFWGVAPSVTVLIPSDPATLFAVLGYNLNFGRDIGERISDAQIDRVEPGSGPNFTGGIGLALNERTSISFAYAHSWIFPTKSTIRPISIHNGVPTVGDPIVAKTRSLQAGRFLFGISYRLTERTTINWSVEYGLTDDASDLRTSLRIPFTFD
ncbi:transporter family protein [Rhizorhabdus argentea]|uniref:hypothetical protein n=1 Tax=Rhizorhabdus argentea TaxID=1387174 RepID=UPI0030EB4CF8